MLEESPCSFDKSSFLAGGAALVRDSLVLDEGPLLLENSPLSLERQPPCYWRGPLQLDGRWGSVARLTLVAGVGPIVVREDSCLLDGEGSLVVSGPLVVSECLSCLRGSPCKRGPWLLDG